MSWTPATSPPPTSTSPERDYYCYVESEPVLVVDGSGDYSLAVYRRPGPGEDDADLYNDWRTHDSEGWDIAPTYWHPLPPPPPYTP